MDREQREGDLPNLSVEEQMEAMGLAPQPEEATTAEGRQEGDLPALPVEEQMRAMGLAPEAATPPEGLQEGIQADTGQIEPEMQAYEAERAKAESPSTSRGGKRQRKG
jgi:Cu/Zn superoxide dismutase